MVADGLLGQVQAVQFTDAEIHRILTNATRESARVLQILDNNGSLSSQIRAAQVRMAKVNLDAWAGIKQATEVGIGDGVWNATTVQSIFDEDLMARAGMTSKYWGQSLMASAAAAKEALISRTSLGIPLSQAVYKTSVASGGKIHDVLNSGLALGKTVAEIKKDVLGFINPNTPGGAQFAAKRLARTEVINAYHETAKRHYKATPWIENVRWLLSGSHPRPDLCNEYAEGGNAKGDGVWLADDVPDKPHPNCLCYIEPIPMDLDKYAKDFKAGKFDNYINEQLGCYRHG